MNNDELLFLPLGGAGEIGMNVSLYGLGGRWLMVDCGITFADDRLPGVEIVVPDLAFAEAQADRLDGIVLTHAHEDHYGAIGHVWEQLRCPVWCTRFTAAMLRGKLMEAGLHGEVPVNVVDVDRPFRVGSFDCSFVAMSHSIPEAHALVLTTPHGKVVHSGDWKLDPEPLVGYRTDGLQLERLGDEGVLALVCDSTNALKHGTAGSEGEVRDSLRALVAAQPNRVLVTSFASNVARLHTVIEAAAAAGREVVVVGRSMHRVIGAAREAGYLQDIPDIVPERQAVGLPRDRTLILSTGCQGESRAALSRIATGQHPHVRLEPDDTAIFSSKIIPGNERALYDLHNRLIQAGVEVITEEDHFVHVSGHPCRDELAQLYRWVRPKIAVPVHGEARHLHEHRRLALELGVPQAVQVFNGDMVRLAPGLPERVDNVPTGRFAVDSGALREAGDDLFRVRRRLMQSGTVLVGLVMDDAGSLIADPRITALGATRLDDAAAHGRAVAAAVETVEDLPDWQAVDDERVSEAVRGAMRRALELGRDRRPIIEVQITRLNAAALAALEAGAAS
jgi:ribonuclease J